MLADGSAIGSLAGLPKETVGVHWPSLLAGSEGTLGVVTAVRLELVPWYRHTATAMVATASLADAVGVLDRAARRRADLDAVELILPEAMAVVAAHLGATPPVGDGGTGAYVVVELADHEDPTDALIGRARRPRRGAATPRSRPRARRASGWSRSATASPSRSAPRACRSSSTSPCPSARSTS